MFEKNKIKKFFLGVLIAIVISVQCLAFATPANAQMDAAITSAFSGKWTWEQVGNSLLSAALGALVNGVSYFMRKLAYDAAMAAASGGKGQSALAFKNSPAKYFKDTALDAAADAIDSFGQPFGLNLCQTPDLKIQVYLQVGLRQTYGDTENSPKPSCDWNKLSNAWSADAFESKYGPGGRKFLAETFNNALRVENTDFGIATGAMAKLDRIKANAQAGAQTERVEGQGFKSLTSLISDTVKTPGQIVQEETKAVTSKNQTDLSSKQIAGIYGSASLQIIPQALSTFINTLTGQLLKKVMNLAQGLFDSDESGSSGTGTVSTLDFFAQSVNSNRQAAAQAFNFLFTSVPQKQLNAYDIVTEFAACPPEGRSLNNCVIDTNLQNAIERYRSGEPLTIQQALDEGLLAKTGLLISPRREVDNTNLDACINGKQYCYSNIQKLRKARVFPLGFELAASKSDPDNPWKLQDVVRGFEDCARDSQGRAYADTKHPFCHLIDPNWIIRAPEAHCEAKVNGPMLEAANTDRRQSECVDLSTCLGENDNGTCVTPFGYCLREKNIWRIGGTSCSDYYSTCTTFADSAGKNVSYLARTLDYGQCDLSSVGCMPYSLEKGSDGNWVNDGKIDLARKKINQQQTIYFNSAISNYGCNAKDNGCSAFNRVTVDSERGDLTYLKKAPDYLGCYDINTSTAQIDWPQTKANLTLLSDRSAECKNFAQVCLPEELGCESYTSSQGGPAVPGVVGNNYCDSSCVGYDTFRQEATVFSSSTFPLNFIPGNATSCQPQDAGCDEFTNIDTVAKGGEGLEYYTDLRYCEKPSGDNQKTFYSWEGSATEGYVLRTHKLLQVSAARADITGLPQGSPAYVDDSFDALQENGNLCNADNYSVLVNSPFASNAAHPDCRALYDDTGAIFYRLLGKTVSVSDACHPLRKTESALFVDTHVNTTDCEKPEIGGKVENGQCLRCYNGGKLDTTGNSCIYWTISKAGESTSCSASAKGCRAYAGNNSGVIKRIQFNGQDVAMFEPTSTDAGALAAAATGWFGGNNHVVAESVQVGQYSLAVSGETYYRFASGTLDNNYWYKLSFWIRGETQNIRVRVLQEDEAGGLTQKGEFTYNQYTNASIPVGVGAEWQRFDLGPILLNIDNTRPIRLVFTNDSSAKTYYLDNVQFTELRDQIYLIKNSWKTAEGYDVPLACDADPTDGFPGIALGCKEYTNSQNVKVDATGFDKLCRPEAVGCSEFYDTYNTPDEISTSSYKLWCSGNTSGKCKFVVNSEELGSCDVPTGSTGCFVDKIVLPEGANLPTNAQIVTSTIIIPADTPLDSPIYLTDRKSFQCAANALGCSKVALQQKNLQRTSAASSTYSFSETYLKNDPANYQDTLCTDSLVGCQQFKSGSNLVYFKNPDVLGSVKCSYKINVDFGGSKYSGWFRDGVGHCSNQSTLLCKSDSDCTSGGTCNLNNPVPCYEDYIKSGANYGIWSNESANYRGLVGICPATQNGCTELVDPADTSQNNPNGKPYYVIYNTDLEKRSGDCGGQVGLKDGCVLFDKTDVSNKIYNVAETYRNSENLPNEKKYGLVPTVTATSTSEQKLRANLILKVDRDRQCSQWLACANSVIKYDENNKPIKLCQDYQPCDQMDDAGNCINPITSGSYEPLLYQPLTEDYYVSRPTSWYSEEYSGYSLLNSYQIGTYSLVKFDNTKIDAPTYLAYRLADKIMDDNSTLKNCKVGANQNTSDKDGAACGINNGGRCLSGACLYPIGGDFDASASQATPVESIKASLLSASCKGYPEKDSPFTVAEVNSGSVSSFPDGFDVSKDEKFRTEVTERKSIYKNANVCQDYAGFEDCSCQYRKIEYKNSIKDYWPGVSSVGGKVDTQIPEGVCSGGPDDGKPCGTGSDITTCASGGQCSRKTSDSLFIGQSGFCLQKDLSRPLGLDAATGLTRYACLTWLPVDLSATGLDPYEMDPNRGYNPNGDDKFKDNVFTGKVYCTDSAPSGLVKGYDYGYTVANEILINTWPGLQQLSKDAITSALGSDYKSRQGFYKVFRSLYGGHYTITKNPDTYTDDSYSGSSPKAPDFSWIRLKENEGKLNDYNAKDFLTNYGYFRLSELYPKSGTNGLPSANITVASLKHISLFTAWNSLLANGVFQHNGDASILLSPDWGPGGLFSISLLSYPIGDHTGDWEQLATVLAHDNNRIISNDADNLGGLKDSKPLYRIENTGIVFETIRRIYLAPFVFSKSGCLGDNQIMGNDIYIDFDQLDGQPWSTMSNNTTKPISTPDTRCPNGGLGPEDVCIKLLTQNGSGFELRHSGSLSAPIKDEDNKVSFSYITFHATASKDKFVVNNDVWVVGPEGETSYHTEETPQEIYGLVVLPVGESNQNGLIMKIVHDFVDGKINYNDSNIKGYYKLFFKLPDGKLYEQSNSILYFSTYPESQPSMSANDVKLYEGYVCGVDGYNAISAQFTHNNIEGSGGVVNAIMSATQNPASRNILNYLAYLGELVDLRPYCTSFDQVHKDHPDDAYYTFNKAWTSRVWENARDYAVENGVTAKYGKGLSTVPFGGTTLRPEDMTTTTYYFLSPLADGYALNCLGEDWTSSTFQAVDLVNDIYSCQAAYVGYGSDDPYKDLNGSLPFVQPKYSEIEAWYNATDPVFNNPGEAVLARWFAKVYSVNMPGATLAGSDGFLPEERLWDFSNIYDNSSLLKRYNDDSQTEASLMIPHIYSLNYKNPAGCLTGENGLPCRVGDADNITVNGKNGTDLIYSLNGKVPDEDNTGGGKPDYLYGSGVFLANVNFYALADENRMPIKRVMLDWADKEDGSSIVKKDTIGLYKNHLPFCSPDDETQNQGFCFDSQSKNTQVTCEVDTDCPVDGKYTCQYDPITTHFGAATRACEVHPFAFSHTYSCSSDDAGKPWAKDKKWIQDNLGEEVVNKLRRLGKDLDNDASAFVCVFKPKVQVLDNWGWCNGACSDHNGDKKIDSTDGCYNDTYTNDAITECDATDNGAFENKHWTTYKGNIIVIPKDIKRFCVLSNGNYTTAPCKTVSDCPTDDLYTCRPKQTN